MFSILGNLGILRYGFENKAYRINRTKFRDKADPSALTEYAGIAHCRWKRRKCKKDKIIG